MNRFFCLVLLLVLFLFIGFSPVPAYAQEKRLTIVPASGPLAGKTIYGNSYALLIGINHYHNLPQSLWLEYAVNDVTSLRDVLIKSYGFPSDHVRVLTDNQATKANIEDALSDLADQSKVHANDRILIYFSGHGQTVNTADGGDQGFLIPYDAKVDLNDLKNAGPFLRSCIQMNTIWTYLESSPAKHDLVIADACYSGLMVSSRGLETIKPNVAAEMASLRAMQVMTAGTKGQTSAEYPNLGHGAFTYKLLEQLKARASSPGAIFTASGLYQSVCNGVLNLTDGKQYPKFGAHNATEGDFLFITTADQTVPMLLLPHSVERSVPAEAITLPASITAPVITSQLTPEEQQKLDAKFVGLFEGNKGFDQAKALSLTQPVVQAMLNRGAYINAKGPSGTTPLMAAIEAGYVDTAKLLLLKGADVNAEDNGQSTALILAAKAGYTDVARLIVDKVADINAKDYFGCTALMGAANHGHTDIVGLLLDKGADINATDGAGRTALILANGINVIHLLLDKKADVNVRCSPASNDTTKLILSANDGWTEVVRLLLENGADVNIKTNDGKTALMLAIGQKHDDVAALLRAAGAKE